MISQETIIIRDRAVIYLAFNTPLLHREARRGILFSGAQCEKDTALSDMRPFDGSAVGINLLSIGFETLGYLVHT